MGKEQSAPEQGIKSWATPWLEIQFFYSGLQPNAKMIIDVAANGALMSKNLEEARELLDEMSSNHYQ